MMTLLDDRHAELMAGLRAAGIADPCPDCFSPRADGICRPCAVQRLLDTDPDYSAMADAQARLDDGESGSIEAARADERIVAAFWRKVDRAERDAVTEPSGCGLCGNPEGRHFRSRFAGICRYMQPSDAQRLARMYARRAKRLSLPVWSRPKGRVA